MGLSAVREGSPLERRAEVKLNAHSVIDVTAGTLRNSFQLCWHPVMKAHIR